MTSDEALSRMCFAGLGVSRLKAVAGGTMEEGHDKPSAFVVDLKFMHNLEVRPGFENYGAAAYFGSDTELLRIDWPAKPTADAGSTVVYPGDDDWCDCTPACRHHAY